MENQTNSYGKFLEPAEIINNLDIEAGCSVADFGCGPGFFSIPFAKKIKENGILYAFDVLPQALESVQSKAKLESLSNIKTERVNLEKENGSKLESESVDWVILKDILFQNKEKKVILTEAHRILKPGGKVLIVEWSGNDLTVGPDDQLRISRDDVLQLCQEIGLSFQKDVEAGKFHYAIVVVK